MENVVFENNKAFITKGEGKGGAIYFGCNSKFKCNLTLQKSNKFLNNVADDSGGAITWTDIEPHFNSE